MSQSVVHSIVRQRRPTLSPDSARATKITPIARGIPALGVPR